MFKMYCWWGKDGKVPFFVMAVKGGGGGVGGGSNIKRPMSVNMGIVSRRLLIEVPIGNPRLLYTFHGESQAS